MGAESRIHLTPTLASPSRASVYPLMVPDLVRAPQVLWAPRHPRPSLPLLSMSRHHLHWASGGKAGQGLGAVRL